MPTKSEVLATFDHDVAAACAELERANNRQEEAQLVATLSPTKRRAWNGSGAPPRGFVYLRRCWSVAAAVADTARAEQRKAHEAWCDKRGTEAGFRAALKRTNAAEGVARGFSQALQWFDPRSNATAKEKWMHQKLLTQIDGQDERTAPLPACLENHLFVSRGATPVQLASNVHPLTVFNPAKLAEKWKAGAADRRTKHLRPEQPAPATSQPKVAPVPSPLPADATARARAEWAQNIGGCRDAFVAESTFVAFRRAQLVDPRVIRMAFTPEPRRAAASAPARDADDHTSKARREWQGMSEGERLRWMGEEVFINVRASELRRGARA